tara:strand:+ start:1050 stop:1976 length:927 start_codon:yes stop_codon:yes gene_type:complete
MEGNQKLLVVIQPEEQEQPALSRAIELSKKSGASITVILCAYHTSYDLSAILSASERDSVRDSMLKKQKQWLEGIVAQHPYEMPIRQEVKWHKDTYEAVILYAMEKDYHVIVKATREHDTFKSLIITPTDWHLVRKSPIPVLMVKEHAWPEHGNIICALNVAPDDENYRKLNISLIQISLDLAKALRAKVHLVNGYPGTPINIAVELPDFDVHAYNEAIKIQHENRVMDLANKYNIPSDQCHVMEGLPEDVISSCAKTLDAELVVLGTTGRTGISAALIGNTAEHVIDGLTCDLLVIKAENYVSPLAE